MPTDETTVTPLDTPPDDFNEYEQWAADRAAPHSDVEAEEGEASETPETPAVESAEESETPTDQEQEEETEPEDDKKGHGVQKRISKLTKTIRDLEARLAEKPAVEEVETEPAAPQAEEKPADGKPVAPKLADFESYGDYETAHAEFVEALTDWKASQLETTRKMASDQAQRDAEWSKASAVYDDYNEVVSNEEVKISAAMESVMKLSSDGVHLAYYFGKHPEESLRIANLTLANNEAEWRIALARAGRELGKIESTIAKEAKDAKKPEAKAPAPKPTPKVTAAPKPPARLATTRSAPAPDVHNEDTAADYNVWEKAREAQLRKR